MIATISHIEKVLTLSFLSALRSTNTVEGSGLEAPWRHIATLTLHPNEVDTARGLSPSALNNFEKLVVRFILGRSSATTTQVLTHDRLIPLVFNWLTEDPRPLVHNSMTPYEQKVSRTLY